MRSLSRKCRQRTVRKVADTPKCTILSAAVRLALHWDGPQPRPGECFDERDDGSNILRFYFVLPSLDPLRWTH